MMDSFAQNSLENFWSFSKWTTLCLYLSLKWACILILLSQETKCFRNVDSKNPKMTNQSLWFYKLLRDLESGIITFLFKAVDIRKILQEQMNFQIALTKWSLISFKHKQIKITFMLTKPHQRQEFKIVEKLKTAGKIRETKNKNSQSN